MQQSATTGSGGRPDAGGPEGAWTCDLPEWGSTWAGCRRRFCSWNVPPRWSVEDWWEELRAVALVAACQSLRAFDPTRGVPRGAFLRRRILAAAWARYRQEWAYARQCAPEAELDRIPGRVGDTSATARAFEALRGPLARLREPDRWLIEHLFWDGGTEASAAAVLGISQQAVSRRKRSILRALRDATEPPSGPG